MAETCPPGKLRPAIYRAGHVPMIGEWVALPLMRLPVRNGSATQLRGNRSPGGNLCWNGAMPSAVGGASKGAEQDVRLAKERGCLCTRCSRCSALRDARRLILTQVRPRHLTRVPHEQRDYLTGIVILTLRRPCSQDGYGLVI